MMIGNFCHAPGFGISLHAIQRSILPPNPGQPVQHRDVHMDVPNQAQAQQQSEGADECGPADACGAGQVGHALVGLHHTLRNLKKPITPLCMLQVGEGNVIPPLGARGCGGAAAGQGCWGHGPTAGGLPRH